MARRVDDELVILDGPSGRYFGLNDVGAFVWDQLEHDCSLDDLLAAVIVEYDIDRQQASRDIDELINQLVEGGLVET